MSPDLKYLIYYQIIKRAKPICPTSASKEEQKGKKMRLLKQFRLIRKRGSKLKAEAFNKNT